MTAPRLSLRSLTVRGFERLEPVSLDVARGEIVVMPGAGALVQALDGRAAIASGTAAVDGEDVTSLAPWERARLGVVAASGMPFPGLTLHESAMLAAARREPGGAAAAIRGALGLGREAEREGASRATAALTAAGVGAEAHRRSDEVSSGVRGRASLACAIAAEPAVLLLDEPAAGCDAADAAEIAALLRRLADDIGCAVLCAGRTGAFGSLLPAAALEPRVFDSTTHGTTNGSREEHPWR